MVNLPVLAIFQEAYAFVWRERRDFMSLAFPAILVLAILNALLSWVGLPVMPPESAETPRQAHAGLLLAAFVVVVIGVVFYIMFSVAWHRRYLRPGEGGTVRAALRWSRRQTRFLTYCLLLGLVVAAIALVGAIFVTMILALVGIAGEARGGAAMVVLPAIVIGAVWMVYARLMPLFPAAAVDDPLTVTECWALTRGFGWRIFLITLLVAVSIGAIAILVMSVGATLLLGLGLVGNLTATFILALIQQALTYFGLAVTVSALSSIYHRLKEASPPSMPGVYHMPPD